MKLKKRILLISLPLILVACFPSKPTNFYLLKAMKTTHSGQNEPRFEKSTVLVKPVKFPEYLEKPQMVIRENNYKLQLSEYHRWAEPLKDNFTRIFIENLNIRIAPGNAVVYSELDGIEPNYQLSIEVLRLDVNTNDQAVLRVKWLLLAGKNDKRIKRLNNEYSIPIENESFESGVEAQSQAIALFADQVAEALWIQQKYSDPNAFPQKQPIQLN